MDNIENDIAIIEEKITNHIIDFLVETFLRGIMGEGLEAEIAIKDVLEGDYVYSHMRNLLPHVDRKFIMSVVGCLGCSGDLCMTLNNMSKMVASSDESEAMIITKVKDILTEKS